MISEEDQQRYVFAENCTSCLEWHHICKAECCKVVNLNITKEHFDKSGPILTITPRTPLTRDELIYYRRRDIECIRGVMRFKKSRIIEAGGKMMYVYSCNRLDGLLCKDHGKDTKPLMCKTLDDDFVKTGNMRHSGASTIVLTDNCLFKYKEGLQCQER